MSPNILMTCFRILAGMHYKYFMLLSFLFPTNHFEGSGKPNLWFLASQSQRNRCAFKSQSTKSLVFMHKSQKRSQKKIAAFFQGNQSIYLHCSGPLLENGLDRPKNRYGRYGFPSFYSISVSTVGMEGARVCL